MIKYNHKKNRVFWVAAAILITMCAASSQALGADTGLYEQSQNTKVLGKDLGATAAAGVPDSGLPKITTTGSLTILGVILQALQAFITPAQTIDGVTYAEYDSFGKTVLNESFYMKNDDPLSLSMGLAPAEVRVPLVAYPVGPLVLQIDGGVRFQANLNAEFTPYIILNPPELSQMLVSLKAKADGAGFLEGYAKFIFLRGGVGGQLDLLNAELDVDTQVGFDGNRPVTQISALVQFLKGRFYAFVDLLNIFGFKWKRILDYDLYKWNGYCYARGTQTCPKD